MGSISLTDKIKENGDKEGLSSLPKVKQSVNNLKPDSLTLDSASFNYYSI